MTVIIFLTLLLIITVFFVPIGFAIFFSVMIFMIDNNIPLVNIVHRSVQGSEQLVLTAVPLFIMAATVMATGGLTEKLIDFSDSLVGHMRGSLAQVNIVASMINSGTTGSSLADTSAIGTILIPEMIKRGYGRAFSAVVTAASSCMGPVIPPSIAFVIFASLTGTSVGYLFLAGVIPGILIGLSQIILTRYISTKRGYPKGGPLNLRRILRTMIFGILGLIVPVIIIGGIVGGVFTPTEAGAVAVLYGTMISTFITRKLKFKDVLPILRTTINFSIPPIIIIVAATPFSLMINWLQLPRSLSFFLTNLTDNPTIIILFLAGSFFIMGFITDCFPIFFIITPLVIPIALSTGINLYHFGVVMVITALLGNLTPPFGLLMFITSAIAKVSIREFAHEAWPYIFVLGFLIIILILIPQITLWLPNLIMR